MILTSVAIAGGTVAASVKAYREQKRKKEYPWTVAMERMAKKNQVSWLRNDAAQGIAFLPSSGKKKGSLLLNEVNRSFSSLYARGKAPFDTLRASLTTLKKQTIMPFAQDARREQLQAFSSPDETGISEEEERINRYMTSGMMALGLSIAGIVMPPLSLLAAIPAFYSFLPVYARGVKILLKERRIGMDILDVIYVTGAIATRNIFAVALGGTMYQFSRKLLIKTENSSKQNLAYMFGTQPQEVWVLSGGVEVSIPFDKVHVGDIVVVNAGESIPVDGTISEGIASIDQRTLTGESQPAQKGVGEQVFASTVVLSGKIKVCVEKAGQETISAQIGEILNQAENFTHSIVSRGDRIADMSAVPMLGAYGLSLPFGLPFATTILNSNFGYQMRVLAPLGMLTSLNSASSDGILIKDGRVLDLLNQVDTVVFDKTGTLTEEVPHVGQIHTCSEYDATSVLAYTAAAEYRQTHPIARAILKEAKDRQLKLPPIDEAQYKIGYGLEVSIENKVVRVGSRRFMEMEEILIPEQIRQTQQLCHNQGHSLVMVAIDDVLVGAIELHPTIRPEAKEIIQGLRERNIKSIYILTGDVEMATKKLAQELGVDGYFANTLPEDKADLIDKLQQEGQSVCYVGDGINDSIALKKAHVSVSMLGASTIATSTAQVVMMNANLTQLCYLFDLAKEFDHHMQTSFILSLAPGVLTIGGALLLGLGITSSVLFNVSAFVVGSGYILLRKPRGAG